MPGKTIHGRAIVFDRWSLDLGGFRERIDVKAIDRTLRGGEDLRALWNHQPDHLLARQSAGTLRVAKDRFGLVTEIDLPASRGDVAELVERRDVSGMSFSFMTLADAWEDGPLPERTILDMVVREVSPVTWPAYPQTSVAVQTPAFRGRAWPVSRQGAHELVEVRAMEYATLRDERGTRTEHSAARQSLDRFLAARAERGDKDGPIYRSAYRVGRWEGEWVRRASVIDERLKQAEELAQKWK